jgi:hypothetical protein
MTDEEQLLDLVLIWEERREQGEDVSAEELCPADRPELLPAVRDRIQAIKGMDWLNDPCAFPSAPALSGGGPRCGDRPGTPQPRLLAGRYRLECQFSPSSRPFFSSRPAR